MSRTKDEVMKIVLRILIAILIVLVIGTLAIFGVAKFWARPGRLTSAESSALLKQAWDVSQRETPVGSRELFYDFSGEVFRINSDLAETEKVEAFHRLMSSLFPQLQPTDDFLGGLDISHAGRIRIAGRTCEKILVSPVGYDGDSIEVWIEPGEYHVLGYQTLDYQGNTVRGFRFLEVTGSNPVEETSGEERFPILSSLMEPEMIPPDVIRAIAERREIALPNWLPEGFKLVGGRRLLNFDQPAIGEDYMPGMGIGQMLDNRPGEVGRIEPGQFRPQGGHFQTVYSDGLNTISVVQLPPGRLAEGPQVQVRLEDVLKAKAGEVWRLFHTGMAGRFLPNAVVFVFGEVSPEIAGRIADSIPLEPVAMPDQMNPENPLPPGLGQENPPPGFDRPRPPGGGPGRDRIGGGRGPGGPPDGQEDRGPE